MQVKDDFCDLIVGFKGLSSALDEEKVNGSVDRVVTPRVTACAKDNETTCDTDEEENHDSPLRLPSATPLSQQAIPLSRHLQRSRPDQAFPRKRTERKAWWQDLDDASFLLLASDHQGHASAPENEQSQKQQVQDPPITSPKTLPSVFVLTEQTDSTRHSENIDIPSVEALPQIDTAPPILCSTSKPIPNRCTGANCQPLARQEVYRDNAILSRSESAPATLTFENESRWSKQKRSRGVAAALSNTLEFHVGRDRGANFLQKQRERAYQEKGAPRIRHAKTSAAQAHVMEARVNRALGMRQLSLQATLSPLSRPDPLTVENAVVMLAKAAQLRESTPNGFITGPPTRGITPARHHERTLPSSPAKPGLTTATPSPASKLGQGLNCEPLAPW
ncbi:unnamed protein product [Phytophthora fragariaefolia]|uniref:Unnamed protein product n=1 Tax=Phytophthora fragariaefolia TaxID=1490495 RepID=A0A9W6XFN8_9STRA|nr:unnamed protein product [Phytophthora fragariaefolia]